MGKDHDRLEEIFRGFRNAKVADLEKGRALFAEFKEGLERHIFWEEEILFPLFESRTGMRDVGPTAVMRTEHQTIKEILRKIDDSLAARNVRTEELEKELLEVLGAHNDKEEHILYPWIDNTVTEGDRKNAFEKMK